ncbi:MAG: hypothetical protein LC643_02210, partial [Bacteroidales bacterium]|nr:hypothetical protein [Bacteroidales bacterium]
MKHIYRISRMGLLVLAMGILSESVLWALVPNSVGATSAASSIFTEDSHDKNLALFRASLLKSSGDSQFFTDSMVVYNNYADGDSSRFHKVIYDYHPDNMLAFVFYYQRNSEKSDWEAYQKEVFQFNASNHQTNFTVYLKSAGSDEWIHHKQRIYSYDTNDQLSAVAEFQWSESNSAWVGQWMQEIDQNSARLIRSKVNWIWNATAHDWSPVLKHEFDYHPNGELFRSISYAYNVDDALWEGRQKSEMDYVDGLLDVQTDYFWDLNASPATWVASNKKAFQYNELGEQFSWKWYRWNRDFSLWEEWWKIEHSKNEATNTTTWSDAQWDSANEAWISNWRVDTKGEKDHPSEEAAYAWNSASGSWQGL